MEAREVRFVRLGLWGYDGCYGISRVVPDLLWRFGDENGNEQSRLTNLQWWRRSGSSKVLKYRPPATEAKEVWAVDGA